MGHTLTNNGGTQAEKENMPISRQPVCTMKDIMGQNCK